MKEAEGSYKTLYDIKCIMLALICTEVVYKGRRCIEANRVPYSDFVYFKAISTSNTLMKVNPN